MDDMQLDVGVEPAPSQTRASATILIVHFESKRWMDDFAKRVQQAVFKNTKAIRFRADMAVVPVTSQDELDADDAVADDDKARHEGQKISDDGWTIVHEDEGTVARANWWGMPEFVQPDLDPYKTLSVLLETEADRQVIADLIGQKITPATKSIWYPEVEIGRHVNKRFKGDGRQPQFPVYIISKGRWESRLTARALDQMGTPYRIVVEPQELAQYAAVIPREKILVLPFSNLGMGSIPARNWVWAHSISEGATHHWILDDNIRLFYRLNRNLKTPVSDGTIFRAAEDFTLRYKNVALSGLQYEMFCPRKQKVPAFYVNNRIYSCILIRNDIAGPNGQIELDPAIYGDIAACGPRYFWRGRYNEDTDLSIRVLKDKLCTILLNAFLCHKMPTMHMKGGNMTELYQGDGRRKMAQALIDQHPDLAEAGLVRISKKWGRDQHHVNYKIIQQHKLEYRDDVEPPTRVEDVPCDEYGMIFQEWGPNGWVERPMEEPYKDLYNIPDELIPFKASGELKSVKIVTRAPSAKGPKAATPAAPTIFRKVDRIEVPELPEARVDKPKIVRAAAPAPDAAGMDLLTDEERPGVTISRTSKIDVPAPETTRVVVGADYSRPVVSSWQPPTEFPLFGDAKLMSIDIETRDPDLKKLGPGFRRGAHVVGVSIHIHDSGFKAYYPVRHAGGGNLNPGQVFSWLADEAARFTGELVGANLAYDLDGLSFEGVKFSQLRDSHHRDVLVADAVLYENHKNYNLDAVGRRTVGRGKSEDELRRIASLYRVDPKAGLWQLPAAAAGVYAEDDAVLPMDIYLKQREVFDKDPQLWGLYDDVECPLVPTLLEIRQRGVRVNVEEAQKVGSELRAKEKELLDKASWLSGRRVETPHGDLIGEVLAERGLPVPRTPKTMKLSVRKGDLSVWAKTDELAAAIVEARRYQKARSTFIEGHILGHQIRGRVHATYNQVRSSHEDEDDDEAGTVSGRLSCQDPNLQQIPKRDKELRMMLRRLFLPEDGQYWWQFDYSQIEYRLLCHYARGRGADDAREQYRKDPSTDYHAMIGGMAGMDAQDEGERTAVKGLNFCTVYGGGVPKIATIIGKSIDEARALDARIRRAVPFVYVTFEEVMRAAQERGFVRTLGGRLRHFDLWEPRGSKGGFAIIDGKHERVVALDRSSAEAAYGQNLQRADSYTALNALLQGGAADIMKKAMVSIRRSGATMVIGPMLLTVHDEGDFSAPLSPEGSDAMAEVERCMTECYKLGVPLVVDKKAGPNWADVHS